MAIALTRRGRAVCALAGGLLVLSGVAGVRASFAPDAAAHDPFGAVAARTPLFSPRRVPEFWRAQVAARRLTAELTAATGGTNACVAADANGVPIAALDPRALLAPASTLKVLTAVTVLELRGAEFRFRTEVRGASPDGDGVIAGDLHLVGGGDPTLATPRYEQYVRASPRFAADPLTPLQRIADALVASGVKRIDGSVIGYGNRYSGPTFLPGWKPNYRTEGQVGPIGALTVNHGFGDFPPPVPVDDPARYAAEQLTALLSRSGIEMGGAARSSADAPPTEASGAASLAAIDSPPLRDIVAGMLTSSDNTTAEMLLREAALAAGETPDTATGVAVLLDTLEESGIDVAGIVPLDGSGLAPGNRVSCAAILDTLTHAPAVVVDGLADAGSSGTLALRFVGHPLAGVLHAKTGQLLGVVALAGVLDADGLRPQIRFAFVANGNFSTDAGQLLQQRVAEALAAYPTAVAASAPLPEPE